MINRIKKLDFRYNGGHHFKYCIDFTFKQGDDFVNLRNWCWETWGPSCELKFLKLEDSKPWGWIVDSYRNRLYFRDDAEINWVKLRWQ